MSTVKEQVRQIVEKVPENATWEQARYELHVQAKKVPPDFQGCLLWSRQIEFGWS